MEQDISILPIGAINEMGFDGIIERRGSRVFLIESEKVELIRIGEQFDKQAAGVRELREEARD